MPRAGEVVVRERELGGDPPHAEAGLHLDLHDGRHRGPGSAVQAGRLLGLAAPQQRPDAGAQQVDRVGGGRIERQRAVDELVGALPLPEREQRIHRVRGEDDAGAALHALRSRLREPLLGEPHRLVVVPDEVVLVGRVHPVAQQCHAVALGEFSGALEEGEPLVDVAAVGAADAGDVRGDRRVARRLDLGGHREGAIGGLDGVVEAAVDHEATGQRRERGGAEVARPGVAAGVEGGERLFQHGDGPALADVREVEPLVAQQPRVVRVVARALGQRRLDERETALALARVAEVRRRAAHELELGHARGRLGIGHDVPQAERALAELGRRRVRRGGTGFAHRLHRRGERPGRIVGAEPVVGDLGGERAGCPRPPPPRRPRRTGRGTGRVRRGAGRRGSPRARARAGTRSRRRRP